jgi:hypothetical protein
VAASRVVPEVLCDMIAVLVSCSSLELLELHFVQVRNIGLPVTDDPQLHVRRCGYNIGFIASKHQHQPDGISLSENRGCHSPIGDRF